MARRAGKLKGYIPLDDPSPEETVQLQQAFGYSFEDLRLIVGPMAKNGVEPVGSMGNDTPLAVLSDRPQMLYDYFKQLFAQVTNPPIDAIREELVTGSDGAAGLRGQPAGAEAGELPADQAEDPDPHQRRAVQAAHRGPARLQVPHPAHPVRGRRGGERAGGGHGPALRGGRARPWPRG